MAILSELDKNLVLSKCCRLLEVFSNGSLEIKVWKSSHFKYQEKYYGYIVVKKKTHSNFLPGKQKKDMSGVKMMDCSVACSCLIRILCMSLFRTFFADTC